MPNLDEEWVNSQLAAARVPKPVGKAVKALTEAWSQINVSHDYTQQAIELFAELAQGHAIADTGPGTWAPADVGVMLQVGETVRVKHDAFAASAVGYLHNGRQGIVVAKRSGDIVVDLTDDLGPKLKGVHYPPAKLERLVK